MGIPEIGLGFNVISEIAKSNAQNATNISERNKIIYINPSTGEQAYGSDYDKWVKGDNLDLQTHAESFITMEEYEKQKIEAKEAKAKGELDTTLNKLDTIDVSGDLAQYEKDLMSSFMETISPEVRQWAFERGVAGGTPDQDLMAKSAAAAAKNAALGKYNLQNQFFQQKESLKTDALNRYKTGLDVPTNLYQLALNSFNQNKSGAKNEYDWSSLFKGLGKNVTELDKWNQMGDLFKDTTTTKEASLPELTLPEVNLGANL